MENIEQRVKKIVAEQLGVNEADIKIESSFADDLGDRLAGLVGEPQVALQQPAEVTQVLTRQRVVQTQLRSHPGEFRGAGPQADDLACRVPGGDGQDQEDQQHDGEQ